MITFGKFWVSDFADSLIITDVFIAERYSVHGENVFVLPCGESAKSFGFTEKLCEWFLSRKLSKSGKICGIGGGSVLDAAGFAASVYKRGVSFTAVPTTFLSQIDAGIGGKTAVDVAGVKNAVGTFVKSDTLIDVSFLETLSKAQLQDGKGELLKYRMLSNKIDKAVEAECGIEETVRLCAFFKERTVKKDFYDCNKRKILNMGHTVGHALELSLNISHGAAVNAGLYYEAKLAEKLNIAGANYANKWTCLAVKQNAIPKLCEDTLELMSNDKKNRENKICFVLPKDGYKSKTVYLSECEVSSLLELKKC